MEPNGIIYFFIAIAATIAGAVPLGLVNLSVANAALKNNTRNAMQLAHGASVVEVLFALSSLLAGAWLSKFFEGSTAVKFFVFAVLLIFGLFFWFKKNKTNPSKANNKSFGFLKGMALNIVSIQVLLFWLLAVAILSSMQLLPTKLPEVLFFITGVWLAKMGVLKAYVLFALKVVSHTRMITANINRIIGVILLLMAIVQFIKI